MRETEGKYGAMGRDMSEVAPFVWLKRRAVGAGKGLGVMVW